MDKSNIVINTLVFLKDLKNGVRQARLLKDISSIGIKKAEIRREFMKDHDIELQEIKKVSDELQMEIYYSVPQYLYINGKLEIEEIEGYFREAQKMSCRNVKLNIGDYHTISSQDVYDINSLCNKYSIMLTVENDQTKENGKVDKIQRFLQLAKLLGMKVYCTFDIGNWIWQKEDPVENANILKPYVKYIHLKDVYIKDKPQATFLNHGIIPWKSILKIFDQDIPVAIEYPCDPNALQRLNAELNKLLKAD